MTAATLSGGGSGNWELGGDLDFESVPIIWPSLADAIANNPQVTLSLKSVQHANSAGLVLLVEARDLARKSGCDLQFSDLPSDLVDLASMSQCEALLDGR